MALCNYCVHMNLLWPSNAEPAMANYLETYKATATGFVLQYTQRQPAQQISNQKDTLSYAIAQEKPLNLCYKRTML